MDIVELFKITSYVSGHFSADPQKLEGPRPNPSVAEKWCLGQWAVFFGFVSDLLTTQCLENRPAIIPGACICVIVLPQSPCEVTDAHAEQHKRTGPNQEAGGFGKVRDGSTCLLAAIRRPGKSKREAGRGMAAEMTKCLQTLRVGRQGSRLSFLFHWLSSQPFLFCQMSWN